MMRFKIEGRVAKTIVSLALLGVMTFSVTAQAAGVTLSSKGTLTVDGTNVDIHSSDIYSLKSAYEANSTSLTNMNSAVNDYRTKAATTYANINTISSGIDSARTNMAKGLKSMGVQYDDTTDTFYAKNTPTDWYATTTQTIGASSHGKTLAQLISLLGNPTISMNGATSQATATPGAANVASGASKIAKTDTAGIALANKSTLVLDSGAQVTLPAGYYGSPITVQNGGGIGNDAILVRTKSVSASVSSGSYPSGSSYVVADTIAGYVLKYAYLMNVSTGFEGNLQRSLSYSLRLNGQGATFSFSAGYSECGGGTASGTVAFVYIKQ